MILYKYIFYNFTKNKKHKIKFTKIKTQIIFYKFTKIKTQIIFYKFTKIKTQIIFTKNLQKIKNTKIKLLKIYFTKNLHKIKNTKIKLLKIYFTNLHKKNLQK